MAEFNENLIKFGWILKEEMFEAIRDGKLNAYDICFCRDTHEEYLINSSLEPIPIKTRIRIFGSVEAAMEEIQETSNTYAGEIISIRDGEKFIAYVVNQFEDGEYYIAPVYSDKMIDYNQIQNAPIINIESSVTNPIDLTTLEDGWYKVNYYISPSTGNQINSIVGDYILIDTTFDKKYIKRITSNSIFDYEIDKDGNATHKKYATEEYIKEQGFATENYVDLKMAAMQASLEDYIKRYVADTCTLLVKHLVEDELNLRYSSEKDIEDLFDN